MKKIVNAYKKIFKIVTKESPFLIILLLFLSVIQGLVGPIGTYINQHIFDDGLLLANNEITFIEFLPLIVGLILIAIIPNLVRTIVYTFIEERSLLMFRTTFRGEMIEKLKRLEYKHFEDKDSVEIIEKAYTRAENSARHLFPMYIFNFITNIITLIGYCIILISIKWWLIPLTLTPSFIELFLTSKNNRNIYEEMESYWLKERIYTNISKFLKSRNFIKELKINNSSNYLIDEYKAKLKSRNKEYESFFKSHLKDMLLGSNISRLFSIVNAVIILVLYLNGQISIGTFIAISLLMFGPINDSIQYSFGFMKWSHYHIKFFDYYDKYFELSEDNQTGKDTHQGYSIEFRDVWFKYPKTDQYILKGVSFKLEEGKKLSIVGANGEGKSTMIKLLLGLFKPNKGEILVGGKDLNSFSSTELVMIFAPIFQDFKKYSITLKENIVIGGYNVTEKEFLDVVKKAKVSEFVENLPNGYDTLLGREFEGGVDLSGGQWQRIAIARGLIGDKPILLLDEPTSQLDPVAEANLYHEFNDITENKTSIFITHRLASTMITDRILVISDGKIVEEGTHKELISLNGIYAEMFNSQKQWYEGVDING